MLHLHSRIVAHVDIIPPRLLLSKVILHLHEHIESLIRFLLAVLDALQIPIIHRLLQFEVDAVLVALFEEELGEGMLLEGIHMVVWIA